MSSTSNSIIDQIIILLDFILVELSELCFEIYICLSIKNKVNFDIPIFLQNQLINISMTLTNGLK